MSRDQSGWSRVNDQVGQAFDQFCARARAAVAATFICLVMAAAPAHTAGAAERASMAIDVNTGEVLHSIAGDEPRHPASLTKMMTLYIVFGLLESGKLTLDTPIVFSAQAASEPPSKLGIAVGETITVRDAMRALVVKSANDVATALAEAISGSGPAFARLMTQRARAIGMTKTTFRNAHGLPDSEQVTTARDMLTLAMRLQDDYPKYYSLFATRTFSHAGKTHRNHNTLIGRVPGVDGLKTGYIRASGFNVVTSLRRDSRSIVAVVFGGRTAAARNAQMQALLAKVEPKASKTRTRRPMLIAQPKAAPRPAPPAKVAAAPSLPAARAASPRAVPGAGAPGDKPVLAEPIAVGRAAEPIAIARVRKVDIATAEPIQRPPGYQPPAADPARPVTAAELPSARTADVPSAAAPSEVRRPSTLQDQLALLLARSGTIEELRAASQAEERPQLDGERRPPAAETPARSARTALPPASALAGPKASADGGVRIQVGAFASEPEAQRQLDEAARQVGSLATYVRETPVFTRGTTTLYRARFAGFEPEAASETCTELRRRAIDCFVTR
ncbi:MAG: serine hydrolase [Hyphomicrobiaceae bacterium]|nr:serine hydrolase [Hyphomicrobiaceae bacterium]